MSRYLVTHHEEVLNTGSISGIQRYLSDDIEIVNLSLNREARLDEHSLPYPVLFYVLSGDGEADINGETIFAKVGQLIECPPNVSRTWKNIGVVDLEVLVIKKIGKE